MERESTGVRITQKLEEREKFYQKKWRDLWLKSTHKHTETWLKRFNDHRCLSQSEESKFMWTYGKDGAMWVADMTPSSHVVTYIYSLLVNKDICDHWNVSVKLLCVCVCFSSEEIFISSFFSYFWEKLLIISWKGEKGVTPTWLMFADWCRA